MHRGTNMLPAPSLWDAPGAIQCSWLPHLTWSPQVFCGENLSLLLLPWHRVAAISVAYSYVYYISILTPRFIEPGGSMPIPQGLSNNSYLEHNQTSSSYWYIFVHLSLIYITSYRLGVQGLWVQFGWDRCIFSGPLVRNPDRNWFFFLPMTLLIIWPYCQPNVTFLVTGWLFTSLSFSLSLSLSLSLSSKINLKLPIER